MDMTSEEMGSCITACLECHRVCLHEALTHCLEMGGKHTEPAHFRLMMNCADICQTSANFVLSGSDLHKLTCAVCAKVCADCAESCEAVGEMEHCVGVCRKCSEICAKMAA